MGDPYASAPGAYPTAPVAGVPPPTYAARPVGQAPYVQQPMQQPMGHAPPGVMMNPMNPSMGYVGPSGGMVHDMGHDDQSMPGGLVILLITGIFIRVFWLFAWFAYRHNPSERARRMATWLGYLFIFFGIFDIIVYSNGAGPGGA